MKRQLPRMIVLLVAAMLGLQLGPAPSAQAADTAWYINTYAPSAQAVERTYGVPASVALAQSIQETGWGGGLAGIANVRNFFGIKCSKNYVSEFQAGCYNASTREFYPGTGWTTIVAPFRTYSSPTNSFLDYGLFLRENSRYANAFNYQRDYQRFIIEVHKAGYANDPEYANRIILIIQQFNLTRFDLYSKLPIVYPMQERAAAPVTGADPLVDSTAPKLTFAQLMAKANMPASTSKVATEAKPKVAAPPAPKPAAGAPPAPKPAGEIVTPVRARPLASTGRC